MALHEVGHALGLNENTNPQSVMNANLHALPAGLTKGDILAIRALYGAPPTDSAGNSTLASAAQLPQPGDAPTFAFGSIVSNSDADLFSFVSPEDGLTTIHVLTAGLSLLQPKVTVLDSTGTILAVGYSLGSQGGEVTLNFNASSDSTYFVRIESGVSGDAGTGQYGLAIMSPGTNITTSQLDAFLQQPYAALSQVDLQDSWNNPGGVLVNDTGGGDSGSSSATPLTAAGAGRFTAIGSLHDANSRNYYQLTTPSGGAVTMTIAATAFGSNGTVPHVQLSDSAGRPVSVNIVGNGIDGYAVQASGLLPNQKYVLRVGVGDSGTGGNYQLAVDLSQVGPLVTSMAANQLTAAAPQQGYALYVAQPQLFHFDLTAGNQSGIQVTIVDSAGNVAFQLTAGAGQTLSGPTVLLYPGSYKVSFLAINLQTGSTVSYQLLGAVISDPIGPVLVNTSSAPQFHAPTPPKPGQIYLYPGGHYSGIPFFWIPLTL